MFIFSYFIHHFHGQFGKHLSQHCHYGSFFLFLLLLLSIMPIDNRTWYVRMGVFQLTKIIMQSNSFHKNNLNLIAQNIAFMYNKIIIKFFLNLFFLMWVLPCTNVNTSQSVIRKCIEVPLRSTHFACENVLVKI